MLGKLEPGKTYLFLDHPGIDNDELKAVHHTGYEAVARDRQGVTDLFTNEKVKSFIKEKGIKLIGYKDLLQQQKPIHIHIYVTRFFGWVRESEWERLMFNMGERM